MGKQRIIVISLTLLATMSAVAATLILLLDPARAGEAVNNLPTVMNKENGMGFLAAALATGLSSIAAGYAVGHVGSAAVGAMTEKPELLGRLLILIGLAEGIAIYGLIISILILNRL